MSVQALSCAITLRGVSASEKLLLLVLSNYADDRMSCWPSHKRLADDTGLSQRTILTLMRGLEARGIVTREERLRADGSRSTDKITLHFTAEAISGGGEIISPRGETATGGVGKPLQGGGEMVSPLTTFEPSINHQIEPSLLVAPSARPTKRASKRVPESWTPSPKTYAQLVGEGFAVGDLERALTRMRDHEFKTPRTDWDATFRNWVRTDADRKPSTRHERSYADQRQAARDDSLRDHYAGAMAALNRRLG